MATLDDVTLSLAEARSLAERALLRCGVDAESAKAMADVVTRAEGDEAKSHGLYRIIGCVAAVRSGKVDPRANPTIFSETGAVVRIDAGGGFAPLALQVGRPRLAAKARHFGIAALAVNNCYHFSALWADIEGLAQEGLAVFAFTIGMHCVSLHGGTAPAFGTNPIAFAFPRGKGRPPFVFDLSSSVVARGEIELHQRAGEPLPGGWALDRQGKPTTSPAEALQGAILPFGGPKGAALGLMVELLAGPLIGDLRSAEALEIDTADGGPLRGGYLMLAIDPAHFGADGRAASTADAWLSSLEDQHRPARLPGTRRHAARNETAAKGIRIPRALHDTLRELADPEA